MRLYEHEAKALLSRYGLSVPQGTLVDVDSPSVASAPCVLKAQVLASDRAKHGGIIIGHTQASIAEGLDQLRKVSIHGEPVQRVLIEEFVPTTENYFVSFTFDTERGEPILLFNEAGGSGVEGRAIKRIPINPLAGLTQEEAIAIAPKLAKTLVQLWQVFSAEDCKLLEINPLGMTESGPVCIDARIELDPLGQPRHKERTYAKRPSPLGRPYTERELAVQAANDTDYTGTVKYVELDGDIAVLAAGGGGSLTAVDALIEHGGRPANYSEFSGDPTEEKMYTLTKAALAKPGVRACWIVGAVANFSRVDTMAKGIVRALKESTFIGPIIIRRAGPREQEGLAALAAAAKAHGWNVVIHGAETPLTATAATVIASMTD